MLKVKELPLSERPYEKLYTYGAEKLSDAELLAIIIKSGTREETSVSLAQKILKLKENTSENKLRDLQDISIEEFMSIKGIGKVKAIQLKAVCELTKRMSAMSSKQKLQIHSSHDIAKLLMEELRYEKREKVKLILLNTKNNILKIIDISYGGINFAAVEPKEIFAEAIKAQAPKIILVHNHPSGDPTPSQADYTITDRIFDAAQLLGIEFLDHIIIGDGIFRSLLK